MVLANPTYKGMFLSLVQHPMTVAHCQKYFIPNVWAAQ